MLKPNQSILDSIVPLDVDSLLDGEFYGKLGFKRPKKKLILRMSEKTFFYESKLGLFLPEH